MVWDGQQVVLQLVDADGAGPGTWKLTNRYLYGDIVDMILADEQLPGGGIGLTSVSYTSGTTLWPLSDHLGSVRDLVDNNGRIRVHVVYNSFGKRLSESDWDASGNPIASSNPAAVDHLFGYTGREWDSDVELQYNRAHWYDPEQGRWKSQDPIGFFAGDVNLYRVVGNHVTGATDPDGLKEYVITIHYYLPTLGMNPAVEQEVSRILQNAFKKHASKEHSLKVMFKKLNSAKEFDDQECGVTGTGVFDWYPDGINGKFHEAPGLDKFGEGKVGQGRGFSGGVGPKSLGRFRGDRNQALAAVIVHEVIFHGIHVHYLLSDAHIHKTGFIDAETPKVGGELSDEACKLLIKKLKAE